MCCVVKKRDVCDVSILRGVVVSISKIKFGKINDCQVYIYTLDNGNGLQAEIINFGAIIRKLVYRGIDVVLGYENLEGYINDREYFGAVIGRNSNRIDNSEFELNGFSYKLCSNDGRNNIHGGEEGFNKKIWSAEVLDGEEPSLKLYLTSKDGDEGFPGEVRVSVTYTLTKDNGLKICYEGKTDKDTILNMTNHSYFNLNGHSSGSIENHTLWIDSNFYTPNSKECLPNGEILSSHNTPFDFSTTVCLRDGIYSNCDQIQQFGGFDHNLVLNGRGFRKVAELHNGRKNLIMEVHTDRSGMQLYTANEIAPSCDFKEGASYVRHGAVCLETQAFPNSMKFSHFPTTVLKSDELYNTTTVYRFKNIL